MPQQPVRAINTLFDRYKSPGSQRCGVERVQQLEHALRYALLARTAGARDEPGGASLPHDVGHLLQNDLRAPSSQDQSAIGEALFAHGCGPALVEPSRLHAQAKRYLVATDPMHCSSMTVAACRSLRWQGGAKTGRGNRGLLRRLQPKLRAADAPAGRPGQ